MRYLLDTDTCGYLINRRAGYERVLARLDGVARTLTLISAVSAAELHHGVAKSARRAHNLPRLARFLAGFEVAGFDETAAVLYGQVRADLEAKGRSIGPLDTLIAAHAVALRAVLVTNNTREFSRIAGLRLQNWLED